MSPAVLARRTAADERARRLRVVPTSLDIYLTDACNMRCTYCGSRRFIDGGGARTLDLPTLLRAVDRYAALVAPGPGADPAGVREVSFTGGEPLLRYGLLKAAVTAIRRKYPWLKITVFTNGTLLDREKSAFLLDSGARLIVSLDGGAAVNDRHRKFGRRSAFRAVAANLRRLPPAWRAGIHLMATFTQATVGRLAETVRLFKTFKCRDIHLGLDVYERWSPAALARLGRSLAAFRRYCLAGAAGRGPGGDWDFNFYFKDRVSACLDQAPSNSLTLAPDGNFYPCDELCVAGAPAARYAVGDARRGVDLDRLEAVYKEVARRIGGFDLVNGVLSPIDRYYSAVLDGEEPAAALRGSGRVTAVFLRELGGLVAVERIFKNLARAEGFGDLDHRPRHAAARALRALALPAPAGRKGLAAARAAADFALYSPGQRKSLALQGGPAFGDDAMGLLLYAALKAGRLGKKLKAAIETPGGAA